MKEKRNNKWQERLELLFPTIIIVVILILSYKMFTVKNPYKVKGELYHCYSEGIIVYKGNESPKYRGNNWYLIKGKSIKFDRCVCKGCLTL